MKQIVKPAGWPKHLITHKENRDGFTVLLAERPRAENRYVVICYELNFEARFSTQIEAQDYFRYEI